MKRLSALVLFLVLSACATTPPAAVAPVHVTIVATTDVHGWFNGRVETPKGGGPGVQSGGLAVFKSYVDALRDENPGRVLLVDSGDMFQGTLESNIFEGEPVVRGYNALGYTAAAVGNHEFDYGPVGPDSVPRKPGDDPLGALKHNAAMARFPFLSANMTEKATGKTPSWAKPYTMVTAGGVKIGIIGLSTPDTPNVTMLANVLTLDFGDPIAATIAAAKELRAQGADAVIVIAHMGGRCTKTDEPHSLDSCDRQQEAMQYLEHLPAGVIDAYFAGHTHAEMRQFVNGFPAVQALAYSREFATVDLYVDPKAHHVVSDKTNLRPLTSLCAFVWPGTESCDMRNPVAGAKLEPRMFLGHRIAPDARLAAMFAPYLKKVAAKRNEPLKITTSAAFDRSYLAEATIGNLLTDAMRAGLGTDMAFINSGGIRTDLRAGDLIYSDMFEVSPFDNFPAIVEMTGAQILEMLQLTSTGERGILQTSGLHYTIDEAKPLGAKDRVVAATLADGTPLDPAKTYKVAMPDFIAVGGDGTLPVMQNIPPARIHVFNEAPLRELFISALQKFPQPLSPKKEGRITILNPKKPEQK